MYPDLPPSALGEPSWGEQVHSQGRGVGWGYSQCLFSGSPRPAELDQGWGARQREQEGFFPLARSRDFSFSPLHSRLCRRSRI